MRYAKYKATDIPWLPEIPVGWISAKVRKYFRPRSEKVSDKDFAPLSVAKIGVVPQLEDVAISLAEGNSRKLVRKGDYVVNSRSDRKGSCGIAPSDGSVSTICSILEPHDIERGYVHYLFRSVPWVEEYYRNGRGIVADLWTTGIQKLMNMMMPIPPLAEQRKIVEYLDEQCGKIDEAVKAKEREVELLKECKQSLIAEAVTKGVQGKRKMKQTGIVWLPQVPDGWSVVRLKHIVDTPITDGPHETPEFVDEGIPFVSAEASHDGRIFLEECRGFISRELHEQFCKKVRPQRNDIFIVKSGSTTGKTVMVDIDDEFSVWSPLALVRVGKKANCKYVFYFLSSPLFQREVQDNWSFGTQPNIAMGALAQLILPIPPLAEQEKIVKYLDEKCGKIDEAVKAKEREVELLKELKQSVIAETVTGQRKVA